MEGKHPHVHGEDYNSGPLKAQIPETPPRAWGRLPDEADIDVPGGNTPTCMGKTTAGRPDQRQL